MSESVAVKSISKEELRQLVSSANCREFIERVITVKNKRGKNFGYSDIARFGGFAARSFPRDVVLGKKRLSLPSVQKFVLGLGLTGDLAQYFRILVEIENPKCRLRLTSAESQIRSLKNLKSRILQKNSERHFKNSEVDSAFRLPIVPIIYAALGTADGGASVSEIQKRTDLGRNEIISTLSSLKDTNLVEKRGDRYFATEGHMSFPGLKQSEVYRKFFLHLLEEAALKAQTHFDSDSHLFFSSSFSVEKKNLPKLKEALRSTLLGFVDTSENPSGDSVVSIACSFG